MKKISRSRLESTLIMLLIMQFYGARVLGQTTVSGSVLDVGDQSPLVGVTIYIEATKTIGTITDINGTFSLTVPHDSTRLVFSYTGYQSQVVSARSCQDGPIMMETTVSLLDEVLVV